jgi:hypothetical protein
MKDAFCIFGGAAAVSLTTFSFRTFDAAGVDAWYDPGAFISAKGAVITSPRAAAPAPRIPFQMVE